MTFLSATKCPHWGIFKSLLSWHRETKFLLMFETPEQNARRKIDRQLPAAGRLVQDKHHLNLRAAPGIARCETDTHRELCSRGSLAAFRAKPRLAA